MGSIASKDEPISILHSWKRSLMRLETLDDPDLVRIHF